MEPMLTPEEETSLTYGLKKETLEELRNNVETIPYDEIVTDNNEYYRIPRVEEDNLLTGDELNDHYSRVLKDCFNKMVDRQKDGYDGDTKDFLKSIKEGDIQDLASVVKLKAVRIKNSNNNDSIIDNAQDIINYCIEILRRLD
jgi:hypothetical protein